MSMWTYVSGVVKVDTFARSDAEAIYLAQTVVNHLPLISGSEGPVRYYLNLLRGACCSSNCDEFNRRSNLCDDSYYGLFESQTDVLITLDGGLRDRTFEETLRETTRTLSRLSTRLGVKECLVSVTDGDKSYVFHDPDWLISMKTSDWARQLLWTTPPGKTK